jgi:DegV family protein with EDD domain
MLEIGDKMRKYIITTDSTSDLPNEYIIEHNLKIIPLYYSLNDIIYGTANTLELKEFYDIMRSGKLPTTAAANPEDIRNIFEELIKDGYDILHISFSSALSCSFNNATIVANDLMEEYPEYTIKVLDSLSASLGEGLLVHFACNNLNQGLSLEENYDWCESNKFNICQHFTVDDLHHLHRGGRVSKATATIGSLINVKPVLHVDNEGKLTSLKNVRGRKKSLMTLVENMIEATQNYDIKNEVVFISHGDCLEDAEYVAELIKEKLGINNFIISYVSQTIGAHSGPGTVALFYLGSTR